MTERKEEKKPADVVALIFLLCDSAGQKTGGKQDKLPEEKMKRIHKAERRR